MLPYCCWSLPHTLQGLPRVGLNCPDNLENFIQAAGRRSPKVRLNFQVGQDAFLSSRDPGIGNWVSGPWFDT